MDKTIEDYQSEIIELKEKISSLESNEIDYKKQLESKDSLIEKCNQDIDKLREHNNYLFTRIQQPPSDFNNDNKDNTEAMSTADLVSKILGGN